MNQADIRRASATELRQRLAMIDARSAEYGMIVRECARRSGAAADAPLQFNTEITDAGEQTVIPGCECNSGREVGSQLNLWS